MFSKVQSLLLPVLSSSGQEFYKFNKDAEQYNKSLEEDSDFVLPPELDIFSVSTVLSHQIMKPEFSDVYEILLSGLYNATEIDGKLIEVSKVDLETAFPGQLDVQLKVLQTSIEKNLSGPLMKWLEGMGWSEIGSSLQSKISVVLQSLETK